MKSPFRLFRIAALPAVLAAWPGEVKAVIVDPGSGQPFDGGFTTLIMAEGKPAIAYGDWWTHTIKWARATEENGTAWSPPVTIVPEPASAGPVSVVIADGKPAVCFYSETPKSLKFVRALDAAGSAWGAPSVIPNDGNAFAVEIVNGFPAVCLGEQATRRFMYARATKADGSAWAPAIVLDPDGNPGVCSLRIVEGRPAVAYFTSAFDQDPVVYYRRAADADGTAWGPRVAVAANAHGPAMEVVNGRPAICYVQAPQQHITYRRAADATGTAWGPPVTVENTGHGINHRLALTNGKPSIVYVIPGSNAEDRFQQALDSDGTVWGPPATLEKKARTGRRPSLLEVNGAAAVCYLNYDRSSLTYLRSVSTPGGPKWPPHMRVNGFTEVVSGGTIPFGNLAGGARSVSLELQNIYPTGADLVLESVTLEGPDAAEFRILGPFPGYTMTSGAISTLQIQYLPVRSGNKNASLRLVTNAENAENPLIYQLTGASAPDLSVRLSDGTVLADGASQGFPLTPPGGTRIIPLTLTNIGDVELSGIAVTIDGPDAGEFSLVTTPAPAISPGGSSAFAVWHATATGGAKMATLHIASNLTGSKNPHDLTFAMQPGWPDESFAPFTGTVISLALQADGKILTSQTAGITQLNADGTPDNFFFTPSITGGTIRCLTVQKDGGILLGGTFSRVDGQDRRGLARILPNGSVDPSFVPPNMGGVNCAALQADGKILVGGNFSSGSPMLPSRLARLHADGNLDAGFNPAPNDSVNCIELQPDGKILAGGRFTKIGTSSASRLARLNPDGTLDPVASFLSGEVQSIAVQQDGRILVGGTFPGCLARLLPTGAFDPDFSLSAGNLVEDLALQTDGECNAGGSFYTIGGSNRSGFAHLTAAGSLDQTFKPDIRLLTPSRIALQADGRLILAGFAGSNFMPGVTRLMNEPAFTRLEQTGRSSARWMRGGSAPEVRDVTFEYTPPGAPGWTLAGTGRRIPGGWELTAVPLPPGGTLRAAGYVDNSVMESLTILLPAVEAWRLEYFHTSTATGDAADDADPDHDGLTNFAEFAFGLSPLEPGSNVLPPFVKTGDAFTAAFTTPAGTEDILYSAEWSATLLPGAWTAIPDAGEGTAHSFTAPGTEDRLFVRYTVKKR